MCALRISVNKQGIYRNHESIQFWGAGVLYQAQYRKGIEIHTTKHD